MDDAPNEPLSGEIWQQSKPRGVFRNDINREQIRQWRQKCQDLHDSRCSDDHREDLKTHLKNLLLIDTIQSCIVEADTSTKYIALSYVWGGVSTVKLTRANIEKYMEPGALEELSLPHTVRDAISWTSGLGERYLWVDSLCVIQDAEPIEMNHVLGAMGHIYASAELTIVAANGSHANYGLPGYGQPSEKDTNDALAGMKKEKNFGPWWPFHSAWNDRGWTFQESLFSRRLLIFASGNYVSWVCGQSAQHELDHSLWAFDNINVPQDLGYPMGIKSWISTLPSLQDWANAVEAFVGRKLTYATDAGRAFAGAYTALGRTFPGSLLQGLPPFFFDISLLWLPFSTSLRQPEHPSWSWKGWESYPYCGRSWHPYYPCATRLDNRHLGDTIIISIQQTAQYILEGSNPEADSWLNGFYEYQKFRNDPRLELPNGWTRHHDGDSVYFTWDQDTNMERKLPYPLPTAGQFVQTLEEPTFTALHCSAPTATLYFGSSFDRLATKSRRTYPKDHPTCRSWRLEHCQNTVGVLIPHSTEWEDLDTKPGQRCEVIAISQGHVKYPDALDESEFHNHLYYNNVQDITEYYDFFHVLWIGWEGNVAVRRGLGIVSETAWNSLGAQTRTFELG